MKKWLYLVLPLVMAAAFTVVYIKHDKEREIRVARNKAETADKLAREKAVKDEAETKAQQDAVDKEIRDKTTVAQSEIDAANKRAKLLEAEIERLVADRERITREAFDLAKQVEAAMVAKRNAEMEEQRMTEMIVRRTADSHLTRPPLPPPPPPPTKG